MSKDTTPLDFAINENGSPFLIDGDWFSITDPKQCIEQEIRNGIIENEEKITQAKSPEIRNSAIESIFKNYPFVKNFKIVHYNNSGDYNFKYEIGF